MFHTWLFTCFTRDLHVKFLVGLQESPYSRRVFIDQWIDDLPEFQETCHTDENNDTSVLNALYRIEAGSEIPSVTIDKFDGNPLNYIDFIDKFKVCVHDKKHLTDSIRMMQLKMHLTSDADRVISGIGISGIMYATALKTLKLEFGQPSVIARAYINKLTKGSKLSSGDRQGLRDFSLDIVNCIAKLKQIDFFSDINASDNLRKIVRRMPEGMIHISELVRKRARAAYDPDFGDIRVSTSKYDSSNKQSENHSRTYRGVHSSQNTPRVIKCYVCGENHRVAQCPSFSDSTLSERQEYVKTLRLCYSCLNKGHTSKDCRSKRICNKSGCTSCHHVLLHNNVTPTTTASASSPLDKTTMLPVVRVRFRSTNGKYLEGNVLVDSGAGTTVIRKEFAKNLGLQGHRDTLKLSVVGGKTIQESTSRRLKFFVAPIDGGEEFEIEAHELEKTVLSVPALDRSWLSSFAHLQDINFPHKAGSIDLILGTQYSHLHAETHIRQGLPFQPLAKRTRLGWYVMGPDNSDTVTSVPSINFIEKINLEKFYDFETLGVQAPNCECPKSLTSLEDKKALKLFETSCKRENNRYTIGLPWRKDSNLLPDNYDLAYKRLQSIEKKLEKEPIKAELYQKAIQEYIDNKWARPLTANELESRDKPVYYLPHHGVFRSDKASTPLRVVFDPACKYEGVSLNSFFYKGPCLIGNLLGISLRFREEAIAFSGDISKMFLQICLPESDVQVHRFLWRNLNTSVEPTVYCLLRVTFGDKPSPDMANFVMLRIAHECNQTSPNAATILQRDRYVDDIIHSCATPDEAIKRMHEIDNVLETGSFKIKEWCCSDFSHQNLSSANNVSLDGEKGVKTLGVYWNPQLDSIGFSVKNFSIEKYTKRNVLSKNCMLYDPLGLACSVTIKSRIEIRTYGG